MRLEHTEDRINWTIPKDRINWTIPRINWIIEGESFVNFLINQATKTIGSPIS